MPKKSLEIAHTEKAVSIANAVSKGLLEILVLDLAIFFRISFCNWKTLLLSVELPQNVIPYFITECK